MRLIAAALSLATLAGCLDQGSQADPTPTDPTPTDPTPTDPTPMDPTPVELPPRSPRPTVCAPLAGDLTLPAVIDGYLDGRNVVDAMSCGWSAPGPEEHYTLSLTSRTGLKVSTRRATGDIAAIVGLRSRCDDVTTEAWCSNGSSLPDKTAAFRAVVDPGHYELVVDQSYHDWNRYGGGYTLEVETFTPAPNATCATALPLGPGLLEGQKLSGGAFPEQQGCLGYTDRTTLFYAVTLAPRTLVTVRAFAPINAGAISLSGHGRCHETATAMCDYLDSAAAGEPLHLANPTPTSRQVLVAVHAEDEAKLPTFSLHVSEGPLAPNARCEDAAPLALDEAVFGATTALGARGTGCTTGHALFYAVTVPPRMRVYARITGESPPYGHFQTGCDPEGLQCGSNGEYTNASAYPADVVLAVSRWDWSEAPFDLTLATVDVAPNAACTEAAPLALGDVATGDIRQGGATDDCNAYFGGRSLYWAIDVPAGATVDATVTAAGASQGGSGFAFVSARESCDPHACIFPEQFFGDDGTSTVRLDNSGSDSPKRYVVNASRGFGADDPALPDADALFTLTARLVAP